MVAVDFQKAYESVSCSFPRAALIVIGLPPSYVSLLLSVMAGTVLFCGVRGLSQKFFLHPDSGV